MQKLYPRLVAALRSKIFFMITLLVFVFSSGWLAFSAIYPMAFDENYHLNLIKMHAHMLTPWFTHQLAGPAPYGAITRDPSYLYHYLMSFPYRLLQAMHTSFRVEVVSLRLINILLFVWGLILLRRLLLKTRASSAVINVALLFFVLTPVVPLLAAHINYDNLQFPLVIWLLLLCLEFREQLFKKHRIDLPTLALLISIALLGSLVVFTFLPFLAAVAVYVLYLLIVAVRNRRIKWRRRLSTGWKSLSSSKRYGLGALLILSVVMFSAMYGVNIIKYHNPIPQCGQVLGPSRCASYPPWNRNNQAALHNPGVNPNPVIYSASWLGGMFDRLFFTINGTSMADNNANFLAPVMSVTAVIVGAFGVILLIRYARRLVKADAPLVFLIFVTLVYVASVWGRNYHDYIHLGKIVAVNGRYLITILPIIYVVVAMAYQEFWGTRRGWQLGFLVLSFVLFMQGGGITGFIHYSNANWYWPDDPLVLKLNQRAKQIVNPFFFPK